MTHYASVRVERLKSIRDIQTANAHANRQDATSQIRLREGADSKLNLRHNPWLGDRLENPDAPFDYVQDFKVMKKARNVAERGGTAPVGHFICVISSGWIEEAGDVHDPGNVRNVQLFEHARTWAAKNFGEGSVLSARMDMDEKGAGIVDILVAPSVQSKKGNNFLSVSPALKEIQKKYGRRNTFSGLQDLWAEYVQKHLDPAIQRGKEKEGVGPDRLTPENYAARAENDRSAAELATQKAELDAAMALVKKELDEAIAAKRRADERDWQLAGEQAKVDRRKSDLDIREEKLVEREKKLDADLAERQSALADAYRDLAQDEVRLDQEKETFAAEKGEFLENVASFVSDRETFQQRENALLERERRLLAPQDEFDRRVREEAARRADAEINAVNAQLRKTTLDLEDAKKLAGMVRTIPLGRIMKMLGGNKNANDPLQWRLPNLGSVVISSKNPNRFVTMDKKARGSGAVDLVMAETGTDFRAAVACSRFPSRWRKSHPTRLMRRRLSGAVKLLASSAKRSSSWMKARLRRPASAHKSKKR